MRQKKRPILSDQRGMALISALLLIMTVSLMAVGISSDTSMGVRIAGYQKFKAISFGYAESAANATDEILEDNIYDAGWQTETEPMPYPRLSGSFSGGITIEDKDFYMNPNASDPPNIVVTMSGDIKANVIIQRTASKLATGSAIQMAQGYDGVGKGAGGGGVHIIYNVETQGLGSESAQSLIGQHYRHVTN